MSRLALTLPLQEGETPASFAARLAYRNRTKPRDFCSDMGLRWPHVCSGHSDQLRRLAHLSGASFERLELASSRLISPSRYQVGLSSATSGTFRRAITRVCPTCVLEAMERYGKIGPFQNLEWLLLCVAVCRVHNVPLIQLPNAVHAHKTYDVVQQTLKFRERLDANRCQVVSLSPTSFEDYICDRIWARPSNTWLSGWDLTDLHQGSLTLGMAMRFGSSRLVSSLSDDEARDAMDVGLQVLVRGRAQLLETLDKLRRGYRTERPYFSKDMGPFYVWLKDNKDNPRLESIRRCVEQFVLDRYPLQIGKPVFSQTMTRPKYMTLNQVRKKHGIGHARVRGILAKLRGEKPTALMRIKDISFSDLEQVIAFWKGLKNLKDTAAELNVLPTQVKALIKNEVLEGCLLGSSLIYVQQNSIDSLKRKIEAVRTAECSASNLPLRSYCRIAKAPLPTVVNDWVTGDLEGVRRNRSVEGLPGLLIPAHLEVGRIKQFPEGNLSLTQTARYLHIAVGSIRRLRDSGYLIYVRSRNAETRHQKSYLTRESIETFSSRYMTLGQMADQTRHASIHVARWLDKNGIEPIDCESGRVRVYEREVALYAVQSLFFDRNQMRKSEDEA